ncbi:DEAD/DEAH box helicase [Desulfonema magnum]|uniref:DEAD-box ATP-dependent RNA helicase RhpA n=1 Tax=Desulfonema magnum TaxID=45655 RepID=A0A975GS58_9BACT|nr:DEAD/DEAH box helicase [Desulfonema magnum]QTA91572.1 DEAD-box ATP-dependent RNA helicase [Desulfonema magnum]
MTTTFTQLNLNPQLVQTTDELGYATPTPIQSAIIPTMLTGQDVIGQAQTGTGKTAAFSLPILNNLVTKQGHVQSLVLAPTRELAIQVADAMYKYGRYPGARVLAVYGGQPYGRQISRLRKGVDIVVGTPGRLLDLIHQKALDISKLSSVVLDEADEMLSMGFISDIEAILNETPRDRQTALFSATLPQGIRRIAKRYMNDPQSFTIGHKQLTVAAVEQRYYLMNEADKLAALTRLFEIEEITSALIFVRTRLGTGELVNELALRGFPAEALNGDLSQDARVQVLNRFRKNQIKVLVATDVAARGLDIDDISHVFNYDLPQDPELYVHRVGRTGRAGKTGIAISLLAPKERWRLGRIESYTKQKISKSVLPTAEDIQNCRESRLVEQMMVWLRRGRCQREREIVGELTGGGHDPLEIAAAALKMARGEEKQRPVEPISEVQEYRQQKNKTDKRRNRRSRRDRDNNSHEKGMVRLTLSTGKSDGVCVSHVMGTLSHYADIPGRSIGKISIQKKHTFVDVPEKFVGKVLAKTGTYRIGKQNVAVKRA